MPLPVLTSSGDLPPGVHLASLREILDRFATGSGQRTAVAERLERIYQLANDTGHLVRFIVFGSFITDELEPNDVDLFLVMDEAFLAGDLCGEAALLFDHSIADAHFGASIFWLRRPAALGGEQASVEYWQAKRGGGLRGIVEITGVSP